MAIPSERSPKGFIILFGLRIFFLGLGLLVAAWGSIVLPIFKQQTPFTVSQRTFKRVEFQDTNADN